MTYEISLGQAVLLRELILLLKVWTNIKSYYDFMVFSTLCFHSKDSSVLQKNCEIPPPHPAKKKLEISQTQKSSENFAQPKK